MCDYTAITIKTPTMKKILFAIMVISIISLIGSCDYDDSNDIDYIIPNDSTATNSIQKNSAI
ncbi:hypothetical protein SAMN04488009_1004 [Maribacter sedimenticola]|uniref:Secreted protein n=1 Tax=Maribacter sedimenticola TaxID=228956 RepID=A0ABY1SDY2_9FLAO|nr:hypothetical protein SAMN04488009_1004 [Maribacter sedimenticola]